MPQIISFLKSFLSWRFWLGVTLLAFIFVATYSISAFYASPDAAEMDHYITSKMAACYQSELRKRCLEHLASDFLDRFSIPEILTVFAMHEREETFFNTCHETAHYIGQEAYKRIGSVGKIYEQSNETCLGGIFHGAIEGYFIANDLVLSDENREEVARAVSRICLDLEAETKQSFNQCHHGLGHALMFVAGDDLPQALALCDNLPEAAYQDGCYSGAFMQNVTNYGSHDHPNAMIREDDPLYPCNALGKRYQPTCYTYAVLERFQGNLPKGIELCKMIPEDLRVGCFKTLGRNTTMYSDNPESLRSDCAQIKEKEYYEACLYGTGGNLVARYGLESPLPFNFCAGVPEESKAVCYGALGSSALMLLPNAEALAAYCGKMSEGEYNDACVGGS